MHTTQNTSAAALERSSALTAVAFSERRRVGARLITGERRTFGLNSTHTTVHIPYPPPSSWTRRILNCGVALRCAPSKERVARYSLHELTPRELASLSEVEGGCRTGLDRGSLPRTAAGTAPHPSRSRRRGPGARGGGDRRTRRCRGLRQTTGPASTPGYTIADRAGTWPDRAGGAADVRPDAVDLTDWDRIGFRELVRIHEDREAREAAQEQRQEPPPR